jgi:hypothetical protein
MTSKKKLPTENRYKKLKFKTKPYSQTNNAKAILLFRIILKGLGAAIMKAKL